jgi:hypothetical protein
MPPKKNWKNSGPSAGGRQRVREDFAPFCCIVRRCGVPLACGHATDRLSINWSQSPGRSWLKRVPNSLVCPSDRECRVKSKLLTPTLEPGALRPSLPEGLAPQCRVLFSESIRTSECTTTARNSLFRISPFLHFNLKHRPLYPHLTPRPRFSEPLVFKYTTYHEQQTSNSYISLRKATRCHRRAQHQTLPPCRTQRHEC